MKLKLARMWDHNGTNMEAIGFMYRDYKTLIGLDDKQEMTGLHADPALQLDIYLAEWSTPVAVHR